MMNIDSVLQYLYSLHRFGIKPGLERTLELLAAVGNPHLSLKVIHVAGTNGKGSVCSMIASILMEAGYKVGLYTSPHIKRFNERIRINGIEIPDNEVLEIVRRLIPHAEWTSATYFEVVTVLSFLYFEKIGVDCAVIETGMGGRFDSTNVVTPLLSIITSIDLDHQEFLGTTLREIAFEKAGIIKPNVPVIIGEPRVDLSTLFKNYAEQLHSPHIIINDQCTITDERYNSNLTMNCSITFNDSSVYKIESPLIGKHQLRNIEMSINAVKLLHNILPTSPESIELGVKNVQTNTGLKGRIQLIQQYPLIVMDVGHNVACLHRLTETLQMCYPAQLWNIVFGVMEDKNYREMLEVIKPICQNLFVGTANNPRALPSNAIYEIARSININAIDAIRIQDAIKVAVQSNNPLLIVGSFYIADEAIDAMLEYGIVV